MSLCAALRYSARVCRVQTNPRIMALRYASTKSDALTEKRNPRNDNILKENIQVAHLVNPDTGSLNEPVRVQELLSSMDKEVWFLELVNKDPPIVKLVDKKEAYAKTQAAKARKRVSARANVLKEIQVTWGVAPGDWAHKLGKIKAELDKGSKVDIAFAIKSKQKPPLPQEMLAKLKEVVEELKDHGEEWQPMDIKKSIGVVHLRGFPANVNRTNNVNKAGEDEGTL